MLRLSYLRTLQRAWNHYTPHGAFAVKARRPRTFRTHEQKVELLNQVKTFIEKDSALTYRMCDLKLDLPEGTISDIGKHLLKGAYKCATPELVEYYKSRFGNNGKAKRK